MALVMGPLMSPIVIFFFSVFFRSLPKIPPVFEGEWVWLGVKFRGTVEIEWDPVPLPTPPEGDRVFGVLPEKSCALSALSSTVLVIGIDKGVGDSYNELMSPPLADLVIVTEHLLGASSSMSSCEASVRRGISGGTSSGNSEVKGRRSSLAANFCGLGSGGRGSEGFDSSGRMSPTSANIVSKMELFLVGDISSSLNCSKFFSSFFSTFVSSALRPELSSTSGSEVGA